MALFYDHIHPIFPNISHAATMEPEAAYFGQFINLAAFCGMFLFYI